MTLNRRIKAALGEEWLAHAADNIESSVATICPSCWTEVIFVPEKSFACGVCRMHLSLDQADWFRRMTFDSAHFGYTYRRAFEKSNTEVRFSIPPDDVLIYLGGLVLSGIIGGLAYDGFKRMLAGRKAKSKVLAETIAKMDEDELRQFYDYVSEYYAWRVTNKLNAQRDFEIKRIVKWYQSRKAVKSKKKV